MHTLHTLHILCVRHYLYVMRVIRTAITNLFILCYSGRPLVAHLLAEACVLRGIYNQDADLISVSIKRGAYVNVPTPAGWTALIYAASTNNLQLAKEVR